MKKTKLLTYLLILFLSATGFSQENFDILIERKLSSEQCNMGYLFINNLPICYSLELPWKDNESNISCIPKGKYNGILRYDKKDGWRIQLESVPNRTGVQIHIGNYTSQTQGCILVGKSVDTDNCSVQNSSNSYSKIKDIFYGTKKPINTPNKTITLTIK
jgi:hypothetical protein